tara:strand:+ start:221 stop:406 length:186 start_codon:yes stop_codon:yes gene_type:complete
MADNSLKSAQDEFADLAEEIARKHGVFFSHISFNWREHSTMAETKDYISSVEASTTTKYRR